MAWLILSLLTALSVASHDAWIKKFFSFLTHYEMLVYPLIYSLPLFFIAIIFIPVPSLDSTFYWCFLLSIPLNAISFIIYIKAIKISPLSLTIPFLAFTPAFMMITGYIFLGEVLNAWGILGIIVICVGGYVLNSVPGEMSYLAPLKAFFNERGSRLMFIVSFLYSLAAVIGKKGILHSSPVFFSLSFFIAHNFFLILILLFFRKIRLTTFKKMFGRGIVAGCLFFCHAIFHAWAISLTKAAYMISVKRLSILFSIISGGALFKEKNIKIRFLGAMLMLLGAAIITIKGQ